MIKITYKAIEEATKGGLNPKRLNQELLFKNVVEFLKNYCGKRFKNKNLIDSKNIHLDLIPYDSFGY